MLRSTILVIIILAAVAQAQESQREPTQTPGSQPAAATEVQRDETPATQPALLPVPNYSGDWWQRPALTGDWGGGRNRLVEHGVKFDLQVIQYLQSNTYGGRNTAGALEYSGTTDFALNFDFQRMGLWPGGFARVRGETAFGQSVNGHAGSIDAPNFNALLPAPGEPGLTTLTEYWVMQFVSEKLGFIAGQVDLTGLPGQNRFASDRYGHFLNTSFWQNPVSFSLVPYSTMTAGAIYTPTKWFDGATLVCDSYGTATRSGFSEAFHSPQAVSVVQALNFRVTPFGLPGTQRLTFAYSNRSRINPDRLGSIGAWGRVRRDPAHRFLRRLAIQASRDEAEPSDGWAFWYDFDQFLYVEPDDPEQGWGVFGRFGWSPGETNPVDSFYSIGVGGTGVIPTRDRDRFGVGYYLLDLSDGLPGVLGANVEQGVELFYNIEVTPWLHITPDIQVIINPGGATGSDARDPAIVCGLRMQMNL